MGGDAREKNMPDRIGYEDWTAGVVRDELHKAGWRLADLLTRAVVPTAANSLAPVASPEPIIAPPGKSEPVVTPAPNLSRDRELTEKEFAQQVPDCAWQR